jgi:hypothetical protein
MLDQTHNLVSTADEAVRFSTLANALTTSGLSKFRVDSDQLALFARHWDAVALAIQGDCESLFSLEIDCASMPLDGCTLEFDIERILRYAARSFLVQSRG